MNRLLQLGFFVRAGMEAANKGRFGDALFQLSQAESLAQALDRPLHHAKTLNNMGLVHTMAGSRDEAMICFRRAETLAVDAAGENNVLHRAIRRNMDRLLEAGTGKAA